MWSIFVKARYQRVFIGCVSQKELQAFLAGRPAYERFAILEAQGPINE